MAQASPTRRALVDLPVNTLGTPSSMHNTDKPFSSHKRAIDEVEEPEYTQPASRVCVSPSRPESTARNMTQPEELSKPMPHGLEVLEEMGEGDSPNSYKDSMSSLVDFDPDETMASQQTTATELTQPLQSRVGRHAETLRLRLRLAHFKVQTNQTNIPLSQLRISIHENQEAPPLQDKDLQSEEELSLPKLLPAPVLRPTAYSARNIVDLQIPSSPPTSTANSPNRAGREEGFRTPALPRHTAQTTPRQTNSPPDSQERYSRSGAHEDDSLTSSAVRGKAAIGLLGLRQER
ncbi:hypothetical protein MMC28_011261 [Mycoblastus sanguinarius]|nr:hypothetical protein [Mycoblastus sanguinarius]